MKQEHASLIEKDLAEAISSVSKLRRDDYPPDWQILRLGEIIDIQGGSQPSKDQFIYEPREGYVRLLQIRDFGDKPVPTYVPKDKVTKFCSKEDIFIARYGASLGRIVTNMEGAYNVALAKVISDSAVVFPKYMFYLLQTPYFQTPIHMISRSAQNGFNKGEILPIEVPLAPLQSQKRIVAEVEKQFSRLEEAVANLKRVKANLKRYKASVLKAAVEGRLTEDWRRDHPNVEPASKLLERILVERRTNWENHELAKMKSQRLSPRNETWKKRYKQAEMPKSDETYAIPQGWVWANLGQLSWSVKDGPHYSPKYSERGIPFISGGNIRPEGIDFSTAKYISPELHEELSERCKPEYGDLLYTKGGTTGIARINTERKDFSVWVHVAVLKLVDSINRSYLQHALNSPHCYRQSQKYTHGVGNQDLGLTRMIWITVPLPSLAEQKQIVDEVERRLSVIEELEVSVQANLPRANGLRQAILSNAFSGKLPLSEKHVLI